MKTIINPQADAVKPLKPQIEVEILPYAIATAGEQARDFAYDQIAKFRPGGANYRRLRALQDAGEALQKQPHLYAAAPELLAALEALTSTARTFRNVPKEEQDWGPLDDEALDNAFCVIEKATATPRA